MNSIPVLTTDGLITGEIDLNNARCIEFKPENQNASNRKRRNADDGSSLAALSPKSVEVTVQNAVKKTSKNVEVKQSESPKSLGKSRVLNGSSGVLGQTQVSIEADLPVALRE